MIRFAKNILKKIIPASFIESIWKMIWLVRNIYVIINNKKNRPSIFIPFSWELVRGPLTFNEDGLTTCQNTDFLKDERFIQSWNLYEKTGSSRGLKIRYRVYVACWAAEKVANLQGDYVECGVFRGGLSIAVMNYIKFKELNKLFYLLDTFNGIPESSLSEEEKKYRKPGEWEECYNDVVSTFKNYNTKIIRGMIPDTLKYVTTEKICYLSLDMNCIKPELAAIEFFWDKIVSGGIILLDDYGFSGFYEQKKGHDQFAKQKGVPLLALPTGQGLIIKP